MAEFPAALESPPQTPATQSPVPGPGVSQANDIIQKAAPSLDPQIHQEILSVIGNPQSTRADTFAVLRKSPLDRNTKNDLFELWTNSNPPAAGAALTMPPEVQPLTTGQKIKTVAQEAGKEISGAASKVNQVTLPPESTVTSPTKIRALSALPNVPDTQTPQMLDWTELAKQMYSRSVGAASAAVSGLTLGLVQPQSGKIHIPILDKDYKVAPGTDESLKALGMQPPDDRWQEATNFVSGLLAGGKSWGAISRILAPLYGTAEASTAAQILSRLENTLGTAFVVGAVEPKDTAETRSERISKTMLGAAAFHMVAEGVGEVLQATGADKNALVQQLKDEVGNILYGRRPGDFGTEGAKDAASVIVDSSIDAEGGLDKISRSALRQKIKNARTAPREPVTTSIPETRAAEPEVPRLPMPPEATTEGPQPTPTPEPTPETPTTPAVPKPELLPSPAPTGTAAESRPDRIRGTVDLPLTTQGRQDVQALGQTIAAKGGFDKIITSDKRRTLDTANEIAKATGAPVQDTNKLNDLAYGDLEGQPSNHVIKYVNDKITNRPDEVFEGAGPQSTSPGESFNHYKQRMFPVIWDAMHEFEQNPNVKIGIVLNRRSIKTIDGMLKSDSPNAPFDLATNPKAVTSFGDDTQPGSIHRLAPDQNGKWKLQEVDLQKTNQLQGGVYLIRHGETEWNGSEPQKGAVPAEAAKTTVPQPVEGPTAPEKAAAPPTELPAVPEAKPVIPQPKKREPLTVDGKKVIGSYKGQVVTEGGTLFSPKDIPGRPGRYMQTLQKFGYPELTDEQLTSAGGTIPEKLPSGNISAETPPQEAQKLPSGNIEQPAAPVEGPKPQARLVSKGDTELEIAIDNTPANKAEAVDLAQNHLKELLGDEAANWKPSVTTAEVVPTRGGVKARNVRVQFERQPEALPTPPQTEAQKPAEVPQVPESPRAQEILRYQGLANRVRDLLIKGESIDNPKLTALANEAFGGTRGAGKYDPKDAYDAMEAGINMVLSQPGFIDYDDVPGTLQRINDLEKRIARQADRTVEGIEFQQFSTPPAEAFTATIASGLQSGMIALEPSAGTGNLATMMKAKGGDVLTNEIAPRRQAILEMQGYRVYSVDGQYLNNLLPFDIKPDVIVMNPPFSSTGGRTASHKTLYGAEHVEQALARVKPGGRVVAIVGRGMAYGRPGFDQWWDRIEQKYNVRANVGINGKFYGKYGTGFDNQILVIDKTGRTPGDSRSAQIGNVIKAEDLSPEDAIKLLEPLGKENIGERIERSKPLSERRAEETRPGQPAGLPAPPATDIGGTPGRLGVSEVAGGDGTGAGSAAVGSVGPTLPAVPEGSAGGVNPSTGTGEVSGAAEPGGTASVGGPSGEANVGSTGPAPELERGVGAEQVSEAEGEVYNKYVIRKATFKGSVPHPANIVESATMSSVEPPDAKYTPNLPQELLTEGRLSDVQLEAISYAGQRHQVMLPSNKRAGFWIGDGTGVGKGREISGIIYDNLNQGRKRAVWLSATQQLRADALRDMKGIGLPMDFVAQEDSKSGDKLPDKDGVLFSTYSLVAQNWNGIKPRYNQLTDWVGKDFDGVIVFDEAHLMKNAVQTNQGGEVPRDQMKQEGTNSGAMGLALDDLFPNARIVYVSATGATVPRNMAYMSRLGLWGPGAPFPAFVDFLGAMSEGGVGAMEMLARDLKAVGSYVSRSISYKGVDYQTVEHSLTGDEIGSYNHLADIWSEVLQAFDAAAKTAGQPKNAKNRLSAFYGAQQRFFLQVMTSLQLPDLFTQADADLEAGRSVVVSLYNTNEQQVAKKVAEAKAAGLDLNDLDFTPREILVNLVSEMFPVEQWTTVRNPNTGKDEAVPLLDEAGNPVINRENQEKKEALLDSLSDVKVPENPLDAIVNHFGAKNVSEITGRKKRLEGGQYVNRKIKDVPLKQRDEMEVKRFQDGVTHVAVISGKASAGISLHADQNAKNQSRRVFYAMQLSWSADKQMQSFGRVHRSFQVQPPIIKMVLTNLKGQQRLVNTVASRLASLGALTEGSRESKGGGLFAVQDLTDQYGTAAMQRTYQDINQQGIRGIEGGRQLLKRMGVLDANNNIKDSDLGNVERFLNRILALHVDEQNALFEHFYSLYQGIVDQEKQAGRFDTGVSKIKADNIGEASPQQTIYTDKTTGANTSLVNLEGDFKLSRMPWSELSELLQNIEAGRSRGFYKNERSGRIYAAIDSKPDQYGQRSTQLYSPKGGYSHTIEPSELQDKFTEVPRDEARTLWTKEHNTAPAFQRLPINMISGAIFPIYDRVMGENGLKRTRVVQATLANGRSHIGLQVNPQEIASLKQRLGIGTPLGEATGQQLYDLAKNGSIIELDNGWKIKQTKVHGEARLEIDPGSKRVNKEEMDNAGVMTEVIDYSRRYFVPLDDDTGPEVLAKVTALHHAVRDATTASGKGTETSTYVVPPAVAGPPVDRSVPPAVQPPPPVAPVTVGGETYNPMTLTVPLTKGKPQKLQGWQVAPGLAVHQAVEGNNYVIAHENSGLKITSADNLERAIGIAKRLQSVGDWTRSADDITSDQEFVRGVKSKLQGERGSIRLFAGRQEPKIDPNLVKDPNPAIQQLLDLSKGETPENIWTYTRAIKAKATRTSQLMRYNGDIENWPVFAERVRRAQEIYRDAAAKAQDRIVDILKGLDKQEFNDIFRPIIYLEDMYETAARKGEEFIPFAGDPNSPRTVLQQLEDSIERYRSIATPAVLNAIDKHHTWMKELWDEMAARDKVSGDDGLIKYFPNQILHSVGDALTGVPGMPYRMKTPTRQYLRERKGHTQVHDSDYIRVMEKYAPRVIGHNMTDDFIDSVSQENDLMPVLTDVQKQGLFGPSGKPIPGKIYPINNLSSEQQHAYLSRTHGGPGYTATLPEDFKVKAFQFNPGNVIYPVQVINNQIVSDYVDSGMSEMITDIDALRQAADSGQHLPNVPLTTDMGEPLTRPGLALGGKLKTVLLPVDIADKLENFRQGGIENPITQFIKSATQAWKSSVIGFSGLAYYSHITLGNLVTMYMEDMASLKQIPKAIQLLRNHLTDDEDKELLGMIEDARIWNSVFYTAGIPKAIEHPGLRHLRPTGWTTPIGDLWREYQKTGQVIQSFPKVAKMLADLKRLRNGQPINVKGINLHGMDPTSLLAAGKSGREAVHPDYAGKSPQMRTFYDLLFTFSQYAIKILGPWLRRAAHQGKIFPGDEFLLKMVLGGTLATFIWNQLLHHDTESKLQDWQKDMTHVDFGVGEDGKPRIWAMELPQDLVARFFGVHTLEKNVEAVMDNKMTLEDAAKQQIQDMFGYQQHGGPLPTAEAAFMWQLLNPMVKVLADIQANKDSFTGHEIVSKSNPNLWGNPQSDFPQTEMGKNIMEQYVAKKMIAPYMQMLRAGQMLEPDAPLAGWFTDTGPFSWKRALGIHEVDPDAKNQTDWNDSRNWAQALYDTKSITLRNAWIEYLSKNINKDELDNIIAEQMKPGEPYPDQKHVSDMLANPNARITIDEELLRKETDPIQRKALQDDLLKQRMLAERDRYKAEPKTEKAVTGPPPVLTPPPPQ